MLFGTKWLAVEVIIVASGHYIIWSYGEIYM